MASILKVDDLRGNTAAGNVTITSEGGSATMQLQQGVAKFWVTLMALEHPQQMIALIKVASRIMVQVILRILIQTQ